MKVVIALFALVAVANSALVYSGLGLPATYSGLHAVAYSAPAVHIQPQITTYSLNPIAHEVNYAHPGYVAVTPGAKHVAPLPYAGASHHVNLANAPGTK
ncbi:uncharacterized protein LOC119089584 isoform X2 [Pollicipes pollicipes]|uniref:uncharacterized protein LOC119089584 isoform X1 n=1 Tax=Pollicipes pollicipes TaxID=41117 RepID=UPI0018852A0F|nr:uncharacterized protein LOC119089584 isoform X1 [Pollicipes pollicipes]XP_037068239.1 uncharacterized protein LOC119089584 isoform X2 [Pollicipes pollicipes]